MNYCSFAKNCYKKLCKKLGFTYHPGPYWLNLAEIYQSDFQRHTPNARKVEFSKMVMDKKAKNKLLINRKLMAIKGLLKIEQKSTKMDLE